MEKLRRLARGELSEVLGEPALPIDEFMRYVGLHRIVADYWEAGEIHDELRVAVEAYAAGVNDYV